MQTRIKIFGGSAQFLSFIKLLRSYKLELIHNTTAVYDPLIYTIYDVASSKEKCTVMTMTRNIAKCLVHYIRPDLS